MNMFRVSQHVEDELQTFLELLCLSVIVFKSQMPKKSLEILSILIKEENIELLSKVKEEIIKLLNNGKEETKEIQSKRKENIVL
jgi:NCAIR mutase (PurE)-related protein